MGFWTMGPVLAASWWSGGGQPDAAGLPVLADQYVICGVVGLVMFVVALFGLRELFAGLRGQLMVSARDRGPAGGAAPGASTSRRRLRHPWRKVLHFEREHSRRSCLGDCC